MTDTSPIYRNADAARAAGFADIPAPPTFGFSIQNWGKWEELQPEDGTPARQPMMEVLGGLMSLSGVVIGALLLTILPEALRGMQAWQEIVYGLLLMVVIIASIMGASASSLFVGWSTNELRIVFVVSILMTALITLNSTAQGRKKRPKMKPTRTVKRKSRRAKKRARSP